MPSPACANCGQDEELASKFGETLLHTLPRTMFVLMPLFGFLTWLFYRKTEPYYVAHLYYAVHFHAFVFAVFTLVVHHYLALKRVFGGSKRRTAAAGTAIALIDFVVIAAVIIVNLVLALKPA